MFTRCGYLVLASTAQELALCQINIQQQNEFGLSCRMVDAAAVTDLIPALNPQFVSGGIFQKNGGVARHDAVVWAYARAARRLKVDIFANTEAVDIMVESGKVAGVRTTQGDMARKFVSLFPGMYSAKLMRQWAGVVSKTPDRGPLLGVYQEVEGFILNAGWGGYGFMGAPAGGKLMAELIISGEAPVEIRPFGLSRFTTGDLITESTIIGLAEDNAKLRQGAGGRRNKNGK